MRRDHSIFYDCGEMIGQAWFIARCVLCGRFVTPDDAITICGELLADQPNATCARCGRTNMLFQGFV